MSQSASLKHPEPHLGLSRKPRQWPAFVALTKYTTLAALRNPATVAFGFIFPLVFITVFGLLGNTSTSVKIGLPNGTDDKNPVIQGLDHISVVKLSHDSRSNLDDQLKKGKIDAIVAIQGSTSNSSESMSATEVMPHTPHYQIELVTTSGDVAGAATAQSIVRGVMDQSNLALSGVKQPPVTLKQVEASGRESRYIDFALPGQIGFSLLSTAIFGTVFGFIALKRTLVLKRMFATPTKALTILTAQGLSRLFFALVQTIVILAVGVLAFKFYLPHGWETFGELMVLSTFGLVAFLGFGYFMAGLANDENSAGPLVNLVTLPQFLLSGVFFSTDNFPGWVQPIANNLPLSYFNQAIRKITTEGGHLADTWPYLLGLLAWSAVMYILAARTFKWE